MIDKINSRKGFTLLELSIVLVIIGLIIGGITVGADMIESAKLNDVVKDISKYKTALMTFKLKYNALPGDMKNATAYWGQAGDGSNAQCLTVAGTGTQTCDGDGDGGFEYLNVNIRHEPFRAWQHLSNSGILSQSFTGISGTGCTSTNFCTEPDINTPAASITGTAWNLFYVDAALITGGKAISRNVLALGNPSNSPNNIWYGRALIPYQLQTIDTKIDDSLPYTGSITAITTYSGTGNTNHCVDAGSYKLSYETVDCVMFADVDL